MKKVIMGLLLASSLSAPVRADDSKITKGYNTMDSLGCMILRECTDGVEEVFSLLDISSQYPNPDRFTFVSNEFNNMLVYLNQVGVKVFLAPEKYFPDNVRGTYHTVSNNFFLNKKWMDTPRVLMSVMRHEGWHAAQDCMAGTIENSLIAIIEPEEDVPQYWQDVVKKTYADMPGAIPWEKEAFWAGHTEGMTLNALKACASPTPMWEVYEPTPLTRKWLVEQGFIAK